MFDVEQTILSQYATAPSLTSIIEDMNVAIDPASDLVQFYKNVWNIQTAIGFGLDQWGLILGVSRYLNISTPGEYFGFKESGNDWAPFNQAPFYSGGSVTTVFALTDTAYRQLLLAKAKANISDVSIASLNALAQEVFGPGAMYVLDLGSMQMAYVFAAEPSAVDQAIALNSGVLPHPTGVATTIRTAMLDNAALVAGVSGADVGFSDGAWGSLTPSALADANTIQNIYTDGSGNLHIAINGATLSQPYFNSLTINGIDYASAAATFTGGALQSTWVWSGAAALINADTYTVLIS